MKLQIKRRTDKELFIKFDKYAIEKLNLKPGDRIKITKDDNNYLSIYKIPPLEEEIGWELVQNGCIYGIRIRDYFDNINEIYKIENPEWDNVIERMVYELNLN